jgi:hypothetical protein
METADANKAAADGLRYAPSLRPHDVCRKKITEETL